MSELEYPTSWSNPLDRSVRDKKKHKLFLRRNALRAARIKAQQEAAIEAEKVRARNRIAAVRRNRLLAK